MSGAGLGLFALLLETGSVADQGRAEVDALLQAVLTHESLDVGLELALGFELAAFHDCPVLFDNGLMLDGGRRLFS